jgi:hypothetical protein
MSTIIATLDSRVIELSRLAYVSILMIGLLLYFTYTERRLGKNLIEGRGCWRFCRSSSSHRSLSSE